MELTFQTNCTGIDWQQFPAILKAVGLSYHDAEIHLKTYSNSASIVFVFDVDQLIDLQNDVIKETE